MIHFAWMRIKTMTHRNSPRSIHGPGWQASWQSALLLFYFVCRFAFVSSRMNLNRLASHFRFRERLHSAERNDSSDNGPNHPRRLRRILFAGGPQHDGVRGHCGLGERVRGNFGQRRDQRVQGVQRTSQPSQGQVQPESGSKETEETIIAASQRWRGLLGAELPGNPISRAASASGADPGEARERRQAEFLHSFVSAAQSAPRIAPQIETDPFIRSSADSAFLWLRPSRPLPTKPGNFPEKNGRHDSRARRTFRTGTYVDVIIDRLYWSWIAIYRFDMRQSVHECAQRAQCAGNCGMKEMYTWLRELHCEYKCTSYALLLWGKTNKTVDGPAHSW